MSEPATADIGQLVDVEELRAWVQQQRWYASKSRSVAGIEIVENLTLREEPPLVLALVQTRFATGTHELYQLLLGAKTFDALTEPGQPRELLPRIDSGREELDTADGR